MKNILKFILTIFFITNYSCKAQMVQTTKDMYKLKQNEQQFINKPLKNLLKEIKPIIKTADATQNEKDYFAFRFRTLDERNKNLGAYDDKVSLYIYVKENIDWDFDKRPKGKEILWTTADITKYQNLTVVRIKVINSAKKN